jgi:hypothetical protein
MLGFRPRAADAAVREHYLVSAFDTGEESRHVTEVCWPVFQTTPVSSSGSP